MHGCPWPHRRLTIMKDGFATCCQASLHPDAIIRGYVDPDKLWEHGVFQALRSKTDKCDWSWCSKCPLPMSGAVPEEFRQSDWPEDIILLDSWSCNLRCPSCRNTTLTETAASQEGARKRLMDLMYVFLPHAKQLKMLGSGELFASPMHRELLLSLSRKDYPNLKLWLFTNGTLLPTYWPRMPEVHAMTDQIEISLDAATAETYGKVRLGGSWEKVMEAIEMCSRMRQDGTLRLFRLNMCCNSLNVHEVGDFIKLAKSKHCTFIYVSIMRQWHDSQWYRDHTLLDASRHHLVRQTIESGVLNQKGVDAPEFHHFGKLFK